MKSDVSQRIAGGQLQLRSGRRQRATLRGLLHQRESALSKRRRVHLQELVSAMHLHPWACLTIVSAVTLSGVGLSILRAIAVCRLLLARYCIQSCSAVCETKPSGHGRDKLDEGPHVILRKVAELLAAPLPTSPPCTRMSHWATRIRGGDSTSCTHNSMQKPAPDF